MAAGTDPLQRERLGIVSQDTGDRLVAPKSNAALQLAASLGDIAPAAASLGTELGQQLDAKAQEQAKRDAIAASGARLADAVRDGKIQPTQNPWYMQAYRRESSAIRAETALRAVQTESASWDTRNDPAAFEKQWREKLGEIAKDYPDGDEAAGFAAAEGQFTPQVLQSNVAQNVQRIQTERVQNLSALGANALAAAARRNGGQLTSSQLIEALDPVRTQWIATGGSQEQWNTIALGSIVSAAEATQNPGLLDATRGIGLDGKAAGDAADTFGSGPEPELPVLPAPVAGAPSGGTPGAPPTGARPSGPALSGLPIHGAITGRFGEARPGHIHNGLDIDGQLGDPIRPRAGGTVKVGKNRDSGNFVVINHGGGVTTSYAHMQNVVVKDGDTISAGDSIGTVGNTGHVSTRTGDGSHLHYVVRVDGKEVDPLTFSWAHHQSQVSQDATPAETTQAGPIPAPSQALAASSTNSPETKQRGPSLYDINGAAQDIETTRYRITSNLQDASINRLRSIQSNRQLEGIQVADALYQSYGTSILTGQVDPKEIVTRLTAAGYTPQAIAEGLSQVRNAVGDTAGLMQAKHTILSDDPSQAHAQFEMAVRGRREGYTPEYEHEVGRAMLRGEITREDGISMVAGAISKTDQDRALQRQAESDARTQANFNRQQHYQQQPVHSYAELREDALAKANLTILVGKNHGIKWQNEDSQRLAITAQTARIMEAHTAAHPGDWDGAVAAGDTYVEAVMRRMLARRLQAARTRPSASTATPGGNPRR
jgi:murein DD-endopeptidase MepM/ murein hydrolase activator NlpD